MARHNFRIHEATQHHPLRGWLICKARTNRDNKIGARLSMLSFGILPTLTGPWTRICHRVGQKHPRYDHEPDNPAAGPGYRRKNQGSWTNRDRPGGACFLVLVHSGDARRSCVAPDRPGERNFFHSPLFPGRPRFLDCSPSYDSDGYPSLAFPESQLEYRFRHGEGL